MEQSVVGPGLLLLGWILDGPTARSNLLGACSSSSSLVPLFGYRVACSIFVAAASTTAASAAAWTNLHHRRESENVRLPRTVQAVEASVLFPPLQRMASEPNHSR